MDFLSDTGKKRRDTSSIARIFAEVRRKIGGSYGGHELISVSLTEQRTNRKQRANQQGNVFTEGDLL
jgi:hypothetical protein